MNDVDALRMPILFGSSLAVGLVIGLERERRAEAKAGVRTFTLITLAGTLNAMLAEQTGSTWLWAATLVVIGASLVSAYAIDRTASPDGGTTTIVAALVCFALGSIIWFEHVALAVGLAIACVALLHYKTEIELFSHRVTARDVSATLQFAALAFVVLPLVPDRDIGPHGAINPYNIWLMVVLVSGVGWAGYVVWRLAAVDDRRWRYGMALVGLLGGLISSTITTLVYARAARSEGEPQPEHTRAHATIITIANLVVPLRLALVTAIAAPNAAIITGKILFGALAGGALGALYDRWRGAGPPTAAPDQASAPHDPVNPARLTVALGFAAVYAAILIVAAILVDRFGAAGAYAVAAISGWADLDAAMLATLRLNDAGAIDAPTLGVSLGIAILANTLFKAGIVAVVGRRILFSRTRALFAGTILGVLAAMAQTLYSSPH